MHEHRLRQPPPAGVHVVWVARYKPARFRLTFIWRRKEFMKTLAMAIGEPDRVRRHTSRKTLDRLDRELEESIRFYSTQPAGAITGRIREQERKWSVERWLEMNASALAFPGTVLGLAVDRWWLALPLIVTAFLFQHAVQGWCPPLPVLRRLGVRTRAEIDREKFALKILRGDFKGTNTVVAEQPAPAEKVVTIVTAT